MKAILIAALSLVMSHVAAVAQHPSDMATEASKHWLMLLDQKAYAASWNQASQVFKDGISTETWIEAVSAARNPLGAVSSREVMEVTSTKTLPGLPDGDYTIIQYETAFANKASAIETVTLISDGTALTVGGYFIK